MNILDNNFENEIRRFLLNVGKKLVGWCGIMVFLGVDYDFKIENYLRRRETCYLLNIIYIKRCHKSQMWLDFKQPNLASNEFQIIFQAFPRTPTCFFTIFDARNASFLSRFYCMVPGTVPHIYFSRPRSWKVFFSDTIKIYFFRAMGILPRGQANEVRVQHHGLLFCH